MKSIYFSATDRGTKDIGWLKSNFTFSFSNYYNPAKSAFGTLITFNDDFVEQGKGFGIHPHINMEIISVLLQGKMNHKDSMGYSTLISEGGVQIMSAGSGLRHEEYNVGEEEVNFLQIWIEPKLDNVIPRYQLRHFPKENRKNKLVTIVSHEEGFDHCWINQNAKLSLGYFEKDSKIDYSFPQENKCLFVFVISGGITIGEENVKTRDAIGIWETGKVSIMANDLCEFLIIETVINQK
jgi:redox-sensitive bicupin YhaK (pirin superfamily)